MSDDLVRTFVAIELPTGITQRLDHAIARLRERMTSRDIKWVSACNIHLTLKFLGGVPVERIDELRSNLTAVCAAAQPMRLEIMGLGAFPSTRAPRVIWAGLQGDVEPLCSLAGEIDAALAALGYPRESRPFAAHVTLARVRPNAGHDVKSALADAIVRPPLDRYLSFVSGGVSIMRSQLTPHGAVYTRLAHLSFGIEHES
jgi:RNA 2',3'-cyclic 3'-phosphodiesterase